MKKMNIIKRMRQKSLAFLLAFAMVFSNAGSGMLVSYADVIETGMEEAGNENSSGSGENGNDNTSDGGNDNGDSGESSNDNTSDGGNNNGASGESGNDNTSDGGNDNGDSGESGNDNTSDGGNNNGASGESGNDNTSDGSNNNGGSSENGNDNTSDGGNDNGASSENGNDNTSDGGNDNGASGESGNAAGDNNEDGNENGGNGTENDGSSEAGDDVNTGEDDIKEDITTGGSANGSNGLKNEINAEVDSEETEKTVFSTESDGTIITVEAIEGQLNPEIVEISATPADDDAMYAAMEKAAEAAGKNYEEVKIFDIKLLNENGEEVQPGCKVKVTFAQAVESVSLSLEEDTLTEVDVFCLKEKKQSEDEYKTENMDARLNEESGDIEFETNHFTLYGYGIISTSLDDGSLPDFGDEPWCNVNYQTTSEFVTLDNIKLEDGVLYADLVINEHADGDLVLVLSDSMVEAINKNYKFQYPGDAYNMKVRILNNSSHSYTYKDNSAVIATADTSGMETLDNPPIAFDGQVLPRLFTGSRTPNTAIQKLFGVDKSSKVTVTDMLTIYEKLEEEGYTGSDALTKYYLDTYNELYGTQAETLSELPKKAFNDITNVPSSSNGIYTVKFNGSLVSGTTVDEVASNLAAKYPMFDKYGKISNIKDSQFNLQFYEPESQISSLIYNQFYQELMCYTLGRFVTSQEANVSKSLAPIGMYLDDSTGALSEVNDYLNNSVSTLDAHNGEAELIMGMYLNGPRTGNAYQNYDFLWYAAIELEQTDTDLTVNKVDESGNKITTPAAFNLYQMPESGLKQYYTDNGGWSQDQAQAKTLVTENGAFTVTGLEAGHTYYLVETAAPEGYEKASAALEFTMEAGGTAVNFTNTRLAPLGEYTITINYYEKGTTKQLRGSESKLYKEADSLAYDITALVTGVSINGYNYDSWQNLQQAGLAGVIGQNLVFNVYYTKIPSSPSGGSGGSSGGGPKGTSTPDGGPGVTTIENTEVPLAGTLPELSIIPEDEVPLAGLPKTGDTRGNHVITLMLSSLLLAYFILTKKKEEAD